MTTMNNVFNILDSKEIFFREELVQIPVFGEYLFSIIKGTKTEYLKTEAIYNILFKDITKEDNSFAEGLFGYRNLISKIEAQDYLRSYHKAHQAALKGLGAIELADASKRAIIIANEHIEGMTIKKHDLVVIYKKVFVSMWYTYSRFI